MLQIQSRTLNDTTLSWGKVLIAGAAVLTLAAGIFASTYAVSSSTVVTETKREGWLFNPDPTTATPYEFNEDAASTGSGSLFVSPIQNDEPNTGGTLGRYDKFIALLPTDYASQNFESVDFDFKLGAGVDTAKANQVYLNVYTKVLGSTSSYYDCRFDQVATSGSDASFSTVSFDSTVAPTNVAKWSGSTASCPTTLSGLPSGSTVTAVSLNLGDTSLSDQNVSAYFDNAVISSAGDSIAYDFEEFLPTASTKDDCKKGGYSAFGFKNQGQCVSSIEANEKASFKRS